MTQHESVEATKRAQEERARLAAIIESSPDAIIGQTLDGIVTSWNPGAERLYGYTTAEMIGQSISRIVPPERAPEMAEILKRVARGERIQRYETERARKDGTRPTVSLTIFPVVGDAGRIEGAATIAHDVTEQKLAAEALEERTRLAQFTGEIGIALTQIDDLRQMLRRCAEIMVERLDAAFCRIWTLNEPENVLELQASGGMYTHTDGPHSRVPVGALKIGLIASERRPHVTNSVIGDPRVEDQEWARREGLVAFAGYPLMLEDRLLGVMAMFSRKPLSASALQALGSVETSIALAIENRRSAAALREALRRTRESDRLKSVFLANLGHEIRTPLNIITGFTGLISHRVKGLGDEELRSFLRHVDQASTRLLRTIDGLVDISKIETGSFAVTRVQVDLDPLLDAHLEGFGPLAHEKGIVLGCTREIAGASVLFDLYCLTQAVAHLLDNAIKFTETGAVQLRIGREDGVLYLEVADTGVGMEPEYVSRLFVPFSQEDVGYTRRFQGMGLGLALVRHYLDFNGASISVRSEKGRGSAFRIHFPPEIELPAGGARKALAETRRDLSPAAPAAGATVQSALTPSTKRSTLLIVASDPETRLYYRNLLKARYSVVEASTAAEGRHRLSSGQTFDLILTDTWLRGGEDGLSLTRWIRESLSPDLPIVALTIHASGDERQNAIDAGCDAYVSKPINVEKLLSLIESLLDADRARGAARGQTS